MKVFIVYCHPSNKSFTYTVKDSFIKGLENAGHSYEVSDLYADRFNPVMSEDKRFAPLVEWVYTFIVMLTSECPSSSCTSFGGSDLCKQVRDV